MGTRELKGLLNVLKAAGVRSYTCGDLSLTFGDPSLQLTGPGAGVDDGPNAEPMDLPADVWDPIGKLTEINRKRRAS